MRKREEKKVTARSAYKSLRIKLWAIIPMFFVVLALTIVGVWASQTVTVGVQGTISFQATDVYAVIKGSVSGTKSSTTFSDLTYSATSSPSEAQLSTWKNKTFEFQNADGANYGKDIVMTITVQNLSERSLSVKIVDTTTSTISNLSKKVAGAGNTFTVAAGATSSVTITFSITDKNKSVASSGFSYSIILSDESYEAPSGGFLLTGDKWKTALVTGLKEQGINFDFSEIYKISFTDVRPSTGTPVSVGATNEYGTTPYSNGADSSVQDVICYYIEDNESNTYALTFYCPETIYAPVDSSYLFSAGKVFISENELSSFDVPIITTVIKSVLGFNIDDRYIIPDLDLWEALAMSTAAQNAALISVNEFNLDNFSMKFSEQCNGMFAYLMNLDITKEFTNKLDTSNVADFSGMFALCKSVNIDFDNFDISNAVSLAGFSLSLEEGSVLYDVSKIKFGTKLKNISAFFMAQDLSGLDLDYLSSIIQNNKITDLTYLFSSCDVSMLDLSKLNLSNVTNCSGMFAGSAFNESTILNLNTESVEDMSFMFSGCTSLKSLDISSFSSASLINMTEMFRGCENLVSLQFGANFTASKVEKMNNLFSTNDTMDAMTPGCKSLQTLDLSNFNLINLNENVTLFSHTGCSDEFAVTKIKAPTALKEGFSINLDLKYSGSSGNTQWQIEGDTSGTTYTEITATNGTLGKTLIRVS